MTEHYTLQGYLGSYEPGESISDHLLEAVKMYWNDYLNFHGLQNPQMTPDLPESSRVATRQLAELGATLNVCIRTLTTDDRVLRLTRTYFEHLVPDFDWEGSGADFEGYAKVLLVRSPVARDSLRIALGLEAAMVLMASAEDRAPRLIELLASRELNETSREYLARATRLYLWGHDPECIIMCRSVLEAALGHVLHERSDSDMSGGPLKQLIDEARKDKILRSWRRTRARRGWEAKPGTILWRAERLRVAGNNLLHQLPELGVGDLTYESPRDALEDLSFVLSELFPSE